MNRGERREINERKWKSKVKKLWNSWGKFFGKYMHGSVDYESINDFAKSEIPQKYKHTSSPYSEEYYTNKELTKEKKERRKKPQVEEQYLFETYCCDCDRFNTDDCSYPSKVFGLTNWREIGCKDFSD